MTFITGTVDRLTRDLMVFSLKCVEIGPRVLGVSVSTIDLVHMRLPAKVSVRHFTNLSYHNFFGHYLGCFLTGDCNFVFIADRTGESAIDWTIAMSIRGINSGQDISTYVAITTGACGKDVCYKDLIMGMDYLNNHSLLVGCVRRDEDSICLTRVPLRGKVVVSHLVCFKMYISLSMPVFRGPTLMDSVLETTFRSPITISIEDFEVSPTKNEVSVYVTNFYTNNQYINLPSQRLSLKFIPTTRTTVPSSGTSGGMSSKTQTTLRDSANQSKSKRNLSVGAIVGIVLAALVVILVIVSLVWYIKSRHNQSDTLNRFIAVKSKNSTES